MKEKKKENAVTADNSESLRKENAKLKASVNAYKANNSKYKNELDRWKRIEREADEMMETMRERIARYNAMPWYRRLFFKV